MIQLGMVPVFVDIALPSYNVDVSQLEAALSPRTRAVMLAHTLGNPFDLGAVRGLLRRARAVADRGQLRRVGVAVPGPEDRDLWRPRDAELSTRRTT
jgi:hypothetical protein